MTVLRTKVNGLWTDIAGDVSPVAQVPQNVLDDVTSHTAQLKREGASRSTAQASIPNAAYTPISWTTTVADTGGFVTNAVSITIPAGKDGIYAVSFFINMAQASGGSYGTINIGSDRSDFVTSGSAFAASMIAPIAAGIVVNVYLWNGSGGALTPTTSKMHIYRVAS